MTAYYNENDPKAAAWLRELIKEGHIAEGEVDERSIIDVRPAELWKFTQCHFFAGIGIWSAALRLAGWPDDRPVWTGSCPCQPFSLAGKGDGFADERHLWPHWFHLIQHGKRPDIPLYGEQVASKDGLAWLDLVQADLEGAGYACRAFDLCAAGFGAPHIRQRLYWMANTPHDRRKQRKLENQAEAERPSSRRRENEGCGWDDSADGCVPSRMGNSKHDGLSAHTLTGGDDAAIRNNAEKPDVSQQSARTSRSNAVSDESATTSTRPTNGFWRNADWLACRDGKWRPVRPGSFPLAHGVVDRVVKLRGFGNGIVLPQAAAFIEATEGAAL